MNNISPYCKTKNNILANICDSPFLKDNSTYLKDEKLNIYELILSTLNKYKLNHPQGVIGKKMFLRVKDLMLQKENIPTYLINSTIGEALIQLLHKPYNSLLITNEEGGLYGIFTNDWSIPRE